MEAVRAAVNERGWKAHRSPAGYVVNAPSSTVKIPTEDIYRRVWEFDTYTQLRQVSFACTGERVLGVWLREGVPWVERREQKVSLARGIEILESE
ncbi:hypothetical protein [Nonomuraea sp. NPDC023979]|uniref:hypothetical protein n=1 Tax=Nonomuraea sp. NPDC023979 TaxID=3154796 RepID=UPI0033DEE0D9